LLGSGTHLNVNFLNLSEFEEEGDQELAFEVIIAPNDEKELGSIPGAPTFSLEPPEVKLRENIVELSVPVLTRENGDRKQKTLRLAQSLNRHHYLRIGGGSSRSEAENSIMYKQYSFGDIRQNSIALGEQIQVSATTKILAEGAVHDYSVGQNAYRVDGINHFFILRGPQVWGGVSRQEWIAARNLRAVDRAGIKAGDIYRMNPIGPNPRDTTVNAAVQAFRNIEPTSDGSLGEISGRPDLVAAIRDMANRI
jgi:hypothetical protein